MKWNSIFTIPDDTLIKDGSVDPMGMQMIWTYFGQKVFENKLTTVSTDIRNYTINLIHHIVLNKFQKERNDYFAKALNQFPAYRNEYDVKSGLLIFMEDLLVYALIDQREEVQLRGILGSSKAEDALLRSNGNHEGITINAEKTKGVLVRQIQLGVNGRYKGPFMNMGLLGKNLTYNQEEFEMAEKLIASWKDANELVERLIEILVQLIDAPSRDYPKATLDKFSQDQELWNLYANCFKKEEVNAILKEYWEDKLGLTKGAAFSVYNQIKNNQKEETAIIFAQAKKDETDDDEKEKLEKILDVEPLLSICSQVFFLLADTSTKKIDDVKDDLIKLSKILSLSNSKQLTFENARLQKLHKYLEDVNEDPEKLAISILAYHKDIMENRGGGAWVEIQNNQLKHFIPQFPRIKTDDIVNKGAWYHDYYLSSIQSIYNGLNPS